jgi:hypothetical protein
MRRVPIDECINPRLAVLLRLGLPQASVETVRDLGLGFDVIVAIDKGFEFEHDLKKLSFGIIVVTAANNQMSSNERILEELARQIQDVKPGQIVHVIDPEA